MQSTMAERASPSNYGSNNTVDESLLGVIERVESALALGRVAHSSRFIPRYTKLIGQKNTRRFVGVCREHEQLLFRADSAGAIDQNFVIDGADVYHLNDNHVRTIDYDTIAPSAYYVPNIYADSTLALKAMRESIFGQNVPTRLQEDKVTLITKRLQEITIRGCSVWDLLVRLAFRNGIAYPLAIVGGTVRDLLAGETSKDVDVLVGGNFTELTRALEQALLSLTDSGAMVIQKDRFSSSFGQLKVMNKFSEPEPLDIAVFKAGKYSRKKDTEGKDRYVFGWSYVLDAKSRDYTVNAVYLQLFPQMFLIDPTGTGIQDSSQKILRKACEETFSNDLGAHFRLLKLRLKGYSCVTGLEDEVAQHLRKFALEALVDVKLGDYEKASTFFQKMQKKLFKDPGKFIDTVEYLYAPSELGKLSWFNYAHRLAVAVVESKALSFPEPKFNSETTIMIVDIANWNMNQTRLPNEATKSFAVEVFRELKDNAIWEPGNRYDPQLDESDDASKGTATRIDVSRRGFDNSIAYAKEVCLRPQSVFAAFSLNPDKTWITLKTSEGLPVPCRSWVSFVRQRTDSTSRSRDLDQPAAGAASSETEAHPLRTSKMSPAQLSKARRDARQGKH